MMGDVIQHFNGGPYDGQDHTVSDSLAQAEAERIATTAQSGGHYLRDKLAKGYVFNWVLNED